MAELSAVHRAFNIGELFDAFLCDFQVKDLLRLRDNLIPARKAVHAVFAVQNLLGAILGNRGTPEYADWHLPNRGLSEAQLERIPTLMTKRVLGAQRVCRSWKQAIDSSSTLQKALWFQRQSDEILTDRSTSTPLVRNLAIARMFNYPGMRCKSSAVWGFEKLKHPKASWREMCVSEPAVAELDTVVDVMHPRRRYQRYKAKIRIRNGIKGRDLWEVLQTYVQVQGEQGLADVELYWPEDQHSN